MGPPYVFAAHIPPSASATMSATMITMIAIAPPRRFFGRAAVPSAGVRRLSSVEPLAAAAA